MDIVSGPSANTEGVTYATSKDLKVQFLVSRKGEGFSSVAFFEDQSHNCAVGGKVALEKTPGDLYTIEAQKLCWSLQIVRQIEPVLCSSVPHRN